MINEKIEEIEGKRNDLYVFNEGHKLGFKKGKQEAQSQFLEMVENWKNRMKSIDNHTFFHISNEFYEDDYEKEFDKNIEELKSQLTKGDEK